MTDQGGQAYQLWLYRRDFETAKEALNALKELRHKAPWRELGKAAAVVTAQLGICYDPFKSDAGALASLEDFMETVAMGWRPERTLQGEWERWLQVAVSEEEMGAPATAEEKVPIKKEELDDLPERFTRLYSPVREAKPSTDAVATPDGSAADVSSTEEVLKPAEGKEKVLFKYYAAAAWMWCLNEAGSELIAAVRAVDGNPKKTHAVIKAMGVDKLRAAVRSAVPAVAVAAASSAVEMDRSKQAMSAWKSQRLSKSASGPSMRPAPLSSPTSGVASARSTRGSRRQLSPIRRPTPGPVETLDRPPSPRSAVESELGGCEKGLREALATLQARANAIADAKERFDEFVTSPEALPVLPYTDVKHTQAVFAGQAHDVAVQLALVRAQLGETLLWMIVSPSAYAEQKAPWVSSMRAEAVSQLEKAAGFLTAVTKVKPLTDKAAAVRRRCETLLAAVREEGEESQVIVTATLAGTALLSSFPNYEGPPNEHTMDAEALFRRLGNEVGEVPLSDLADVIRGMGCVPAPSADELAAVKMQFKSSGKTPGYISLSEFTAWMMAGLM